MSSKRRPHHAKELQQVVQRSQSLQKILATVGQQADLAALFHQYLQPAAREHCHFSQFQQGILTISVNNSMWATRLRYQQQRLLTQLRQHQAFASLQSIQLKVSPSYSREEIKTAPKSAPIQISETASANFAALADEAQDPQLKAVLLRLAGK